MAFPIPDNEALRIRTLNALGVLDGPADPVFDNLVQLLTRTFDVPTALVTLVDTGRQWFLARCGTEERQTPRPIAFCTYAINTPDQVMVVRDATKDPRFSSNPLVTGAPGVRFYVGAPLIMSNGVAVGTLCLVDSVPRDFSEGDQGILRDQARFVAAHLEAPLVRAQTLMHSAERDWADDEIRRKNRLIRDFARILESRIEGPSQELGDLARRVAAKVRNTDDARRLQRTSEELAQVVTACRAYLEADLAVPLQSVDLSAVVQQVVAYNAGRVARVQGEVVVGPLASVHSSASKLTTVLRAVVDNALRYCGSTAPRVEVFCEQHPGVVRLCVRDSGEGISEAERDYVFVPMYSGIAALGQERPGLGLSTSRAIVEALGGQLLIKARTEGGTEVWIDLPAA